MTPPSAPRLRGLAVLVGSLGLLGPGCKTEPRIGEYVWVEWEGRDYPAYVIERKAPRLRVHYDGYDSRWDEDVTLDRIHGRVVGPVSPPPPPEKVARALGLRPTPSGSAEATSSWAAGDRVRVRWRGSIYPATVLAVAAPGQIQVHYDGYGSEWDEVIADDRIAGKR